MTRINQIRLLLLLAVVLVYGQVVTHDFVDWDDGPLLFKNMNLVHPTLAALSHHWQPRNPDNVSMYNPLVFSLWWLIAHLSDVQSPDVLGATLNPYFFHAANLLVHWLCACAVLEILRRLKLRDWPAAGGALVFAIHPLQTESVAWASAMKDLLSGLFAFLAIWQYIVALDSHPPARLRNYSLATVLFIAAMLAKPSTVVLPLIVGAIDFLFYRRSWKSIALWTFPWYVLTIPIIIIAARIQPILPEIRTSIWLHPVIALDALAFYLYKLVLPINLKFDYGRNPHAVLTDPSLYHPLYWTWIFPVAVALVIWRSRRKYLWLAGAIFLLGLLPVLGLKNFAYQYYTTVADRYVYLPMLGVALAVAWWMEFRFSRARFVIFVAVITLFASLSFLQAQRWTDTETLYAYALNNTKPIHLIILGSYQDDLADPYLRRAQQAEHRRDYAAERQLLNQGIAFMEKAMDYYKTAIRVAPTDTHGYDMLARDLDQLDRIPEAIRVVKQWIAVEPETDPVARQPAGRLQGLLGALYLKNRQFPQAVDALKKSLAEKDDPDIRKLLAVAELAQARFAPNSTRPATSP